MKVKERSEINPVSLDFLNKVTYITTILITTKNKHMKLTTHFGNLILEQGPDYTDLKPDTENEMSVVIIGLDSDNDGPYWEDDSRNWQTLNEMCHELFDENLYRVASSESNLKEMGISDTLIDSASFNVDSQTIHVWVTNDVLGLFNFIRDFIIQDLSHKANQWLPENTNNFEEELHSVLGFAKESFYRWYDFDLNDLESAFESVAIGNDLEII